ncbi:MAG TPA: hypothetical protein VMS37_13225 [Verrucomicrobiae bacterium]|nr:hypothetical protein [Verrucomicrobiae bacterium]
MSSSVTQPIVPMRMTRPESLFRDPVITVPKRSYIARTISLPRPPASSATTVWERFSRAHEGSPIASQPSRSIRQRRAWRASTRGRPSSWIISSASARPVTSATVVVKGVSVFSAESIARRRSQ